MVRTCHLADLPFLYEICHLTGDSGGDATGIVSDRSLIGQLYAAPYLVHDPQWCWVAVDSDGPLGYLVSTPNTKVFNLWMDSFWLPGVRSLYEEKTSPPLSEFEDHLLTAIKRPMYTPPVADEYPAHFHIDVLPRGQGKGLAAELVARFISKIREDKVAGFHLGVSGENGRALAFYTKMGFQTLQLTDWGKFVGQKL